MMNLDLIKYYKKKHFILLETISLRIGNFSFPYSKLLTD